MRFRREVNFVERHLVGYSIPNVADPAIIVPADHGKEDCAEQIARDRALRELVPH
jgi:hypothetical protein